MRTAHAQPLRRRLAMLSRSRLTSLFASTRLLCRLRYSPSSISISKRSRTSTPYSGDSTLMVAHRDGSCSAVGAGGGNRAPRTEGHGYSGTCCCSARWQGSIRRESGPCFSSSPESGRCVGSRRTLGAGSGVSLIVGVLVLCALKDVGGREEHLGSPGDRDRGGRAGAGGRSARGHRCGRATARPEAGAPRQS